MHPLASLLQVLKNKNVQNALGGAGLAGAAGKGLGTLLGQRKQAPASNAAPVPIAREIMNLTAQRPLQGGYADEGNINLMGY